MNRKLPAKTFVLLFTALTFSAASRAQTPEIKFIAETLVVQAEGTYEADPDLATLTFDISSQEKELKPAYEKASQSLRKIVELADRNGVKKEDVSTGVLTVTPDYGGDRKKRPRSYLVGGQIVLKVRDFSKLGSLMDDAVQDGIADFRSLTYSLSDEEASKQRAVADAMKHAIGRATAALAQKGQKIGALRFASLDVKQLMGVAQIGSVSETVEVSSTSGGFFNRRGKIAPPPPPVGHPEKILVSATVQCAFQIE
ncbi:MAG TPA: SIMPL domain-containing protein [Candidatus Dormibacteraeota bacterium]|nr:SIMPL domain-containing protein [Candidatus Dormibacteraeota bacterium]